MVTPDPFAPPMQAILTCAEEALTADDRPVGLASLTPGGIPAHDNCCNGPAGGQLWVRLAGAFPSGNPFPQPDTTARCPTGLAVQIAVGVIRCVHTISDNMAFPTAEEMTADALGITQDAATILDVLRCCAPDDRWAIMIGRWNPLGPLGGCAGGEWTATLAVDLCACP